MVKGSKKRWLTGALAGIVAVSLLAGCASSGSNENTQTNNQGNSNGGTNANSESPDNKPAEKKLLKFWTTSPEIAKADSPGVQAIRDKFGIDVEFVPTGGEGFKEKVNLMISSGDIPDWMKEPSFTDYDKYMQQGIITEIPQELIEQHMPKYVEWLKRFLGDDPFKYVRRDGKIYALPVIWDIGIDGMQLAFREDWLKKVGIAKTPETIEEMEAVLTKFRNDDPDENGKKDTYGITSAGDNIESMFSSVFGAFDAYPNIFREKDGKVVRGEIEPGAKQALEVLNRWYKNELIDPEFVVNKGNNVEDKVLTDKAGAVEFYWWSFLPGNAFLGGEQWFDKLKAKHPDFGFATTGGVKGPDGHYGISQYNPAYASGVVFGKQLEDDQDKMIKYMQVFEASQFDPDIYEKLNFGVKDRDWKVGANGTVEYIAPYTDEKERQKLGLGGYSMSGSFNDYDFQTSYTSDASMRQLAKDTRAKGTRNIDILAPFNKPLYNETQDKLKQFTTQNFIDFITGRKSLDDFDAFVKEWMSMGGDKVLEEAQQVYDQNLKQ
ncbi:extracellular solute-binding protein [Paenibacillus sp. LHD-117]|uniref:extracellular solute-binding protein n=1 Tax=Paenibacillus sp. LHD-117 TaxID=3071412 RepID=UPI0027E03995|nr:extracellular solute-binding protein [Paenibacillus sp. LHD-117]MDQ6423479.1 extracellular solute-binding protein [Paenibacillus sp. LHD-117]